MPEEGNSQDIQLKDETYFEFRVDGYKDVAAGAVKIEYTDGMWKLQDLNERAVSDKDYAPAFLKMAAARSESGVQVLSAGERPASQGGGLTPFLAYPWHFVVTAAVALVLGAALTQCEAPDEGRPGTPSQQVER